MPVHLWLQIGMLVDWLWLQNHVQPTAQQLRLYWSRAANVMFPLAAVLTLCRFPKQESQLTEMTRLHRFVCGIALICAAGVLIDLMWSQSHPRQAAQILRFYWYRVSDVMIPLAVVIAVLRELIYLQSPILRRSLTSLTCLTVLTIGSLSARDAWSDPLPGAFVQLRKFVPAEERPEQFRQWLEMCEWLKKNTSTNARLLTPRGQQTLKWYAFRGEITNWKDVPQDAAEVVKWYRRQQHIFPRDAKRHGLVFWPDSVLVGMMRLYEADFLLLDRSKSKRELDGDFFEKVHPLNGHSTFELYRPRETAPELESPTANILSSPHPAQLSATRAPTILGAALGKQ